MSQQKVATHLFDTLYAQQRRVPRYLSLQYFDGVRYSRLASDCR